MNARPVVLVGAAVLLLSAPAAAQSSCPEIGWKLGAAPVFLNDTNEGTIGLASSFEACKPEYNTRPRFPRARFFRTLVQGTVPFKELAIPQNVEASLWYGASVSLSERAPDDPNAPLDAMPAPYKFHHGFLGYGLRVQYESSADFEEQAVAGGMELRYVDPARPVLPSTVVQFDFVKPARSSVRDSAGLEKSVHSRLGVRTYWLVPVRRFQLELDGAYFWSFGLDEVLGDGDLAHGPFAGGTLSYATGWSIGSVLVETVFLGYAYGQRPTGTPERKAWTFGVEFGH